MKVYVCASSSELDRAHYWMTRLREQGIEVTLDWVKEIREVGEANPREASVADRLAWGDTDLQGVADADVCWFLVPGEGSGRGAYFEMGYARALGLELVFSGDTLQSIFCAQGEEFVEDEHAFGYIGFLTMGGSTP